MQLNIALTKKKDLKQGEGGIDINRDIPAEVK
jgi:hypothetical protein